MSADSPVAILYGSDGYERGTVSHPVRIDPVGTTTQPVQIDGYSGIFPVQITNNLLKERLDGYSIGPLPVMVVSPNRTKTSVDGYSVTYVPVKLVSPNRLGMSLDGYSVSRLPTFARIDGYSTGPFPTTVRNQVSVKLDGYSIGLLPVRMSAGSVVGNRIDGYSIGPLPVMLSSPNKVKTSVDGYSVAFTPVKIVSPNRLGTSIDGYSISRLPTFARIDGYSTGALPVRISNNLLKERLDGYSIGPLPVLLASPNRVKTSVDGYSVAFTPVKIVSPNRIGTSLDGYSISRLPTFARIDGYSTGAIPVSIRNNRLNQRLDGYSIGPLPVMLSSPNRVKTSVDGYSVAFTPVKVVSPNKLGTSIDGYSTGAIPVRISNNRLNERLDGYSIGPLPVLLASPNRVKTSLDGYSIGQLPVRGAGTPGNPSNGVLSIQGVVGGTAVPVAGSFSSAVIPNATDTTGTIAALNGTVAAAIQGYSSCAVVLTGTWVATLVFEQSHDGGTTWGSGAFVASPPAASPFPVLAMFIEANGDYQTIGMGPTTHVRIRAAAYTSGTVGVRLVFADSPPAILAAFTSLMQNVMTSIYNNSTANLAAGASFTGIAESTLGVAGIQVNCKSSQPILVQVQQSPDGTNWDISDDQVFMAGEGDGRTYQAVASFFRVIATNQGNATTTYLRLQVALCPIVEAVPRSLTPHGKLKLASMSTSWAPDPANLQDLSDGRALLMDADRNLNVRARVLTDEASFRDDFAVGELYNDLTGTVYFTNGSTVVTGVGTAFTTELNKQRHIKQSTHADSAYVLVGEVMSDTYLELAEPYTGATASGTGRSSYWQYEIGSGAAITQTGSEILLASGTTSGTRVKASRGGDYPPYVIGFKARVTQRIANQIITVGLGDAEYDTAENQAMLVLDGTTNTSVKLRTSSSSADVEITTVTLPDALVSSTAAYYQLEVTASKVTLFCNDVRLAEHKLHIPGPYSLMDCHADIHNTGVAGSTTTLALDTYFLTNFDRVEVSNAPKGDPLAVKEMRATLATSANVSAAVADTQLLAPNPNRLSYSVYNDSVAVLYLKHGSGASATSFKVALGRYDYYEFSGYTGRVNAYWSAATGSARVSEES
jgi:hypothetical protein